MDQKLYTVVAVAGFRLGGLLYPPGASVWLSDEQIENLLNPSDVVLGGGTGANPPPLDPATATLTLAQGRNALRLTLADIERIITGAGRPVVKLIAEAVAALTAAIQGVSTDLLARFGVIETTLDGIESALDAKASNDALTAGLAKRLDVSEPQLLSAQQRALGQANLGIPAAIDAAISAASPYSLSVATLADLNAAAAVVPAGGRAQVRTGAGAGEYTKVGATMVYTGPTTGALEQRTRSIEADVATQTGAVTLYAGFGASQPIGPWLRPGFFPYFADAADDYRFSGIGICSEATKSWEVYIDPLGLGWQLYVVMRVGATAYVVAGIDEQGKRRRWSRIKRSYVREEDLPAVTVAKHSALPLADQMRGTIVAEMMRLRAIEAAGAPQPVALPAKPSTAPDYPEISYNHARFAKPVSCQIPVITVTAGPNGKRIWLGWYGKIDIPAGETGETMPCYASLAFSDDLGLNFRHVLYVTAPYSETSPFGFSGTMGVGDEYLGRMHDGSLVFLYTVQQTGKTKSAFGFRISDPAAPVPAGTGHIPHFKPDGVTPYFDVGPQCYLANGSAARPRNFGTTTYVLTYEPPIGQTPDGNGNYGPQYGVWLHKLRAYGNTLHAERISLVPFQTNPASLDFQEPYFVFFGDNCIFLIFRTTGRHFYTTSRDGGKTWTVPAEFTAVPTTSSRAALVAAARRLFLIHNDTDIGSRSLMALAATEADSDGATATWIRNTVFDPRGVTPPRVSYPDADDPWIDPATGEWDHKIHSAHDCGRRRVTDTLNADGVTYKGEFVICIHDIDEYDAGRPFTTMRSYAP